MKKALKVMDKIPSDNILEASCFQIVSGFLLKCISKGEHFILDCKEERRFQIFFEIACCNMVFGVRVHC